MIKFFSDYNEMVMKPYRQWVQKHKIEYYVIWPLISWFVAMIFVYHEDIEKKLKDMFERKEEES